VEVCHLSDSKEDLKNRAKLIYQADETEAISLPCKSPSLINLYEKLIKRIRRFQIKPSFIRILKREMFYSKNTYSHAVLQSCSLNKHRAQSSGLRVFSSALCVLCPEHLNRYAVMPLIR